MSYNLNVKIAKAHNSRKFKRNESLRASIERPVSSLALTEKEQKQTRVSHLADRWPLVFGQTFARLVMTLFTICFMQEQHESDFDDIALNILLIKIILQRYASFSLLSNNGPNCFFSC